MEPTKPPMNSSLLSNCAFNSQYYRTNMEKWKWKWNQSVYTDKHAVGIFQKNEFEKSFIHIIFSVFDVVVVIIGDGNNFNCIGIIYSWA